MENVEMQIQELGRMLQVVQTEVADMVEALRTENAEARIREMERMLQAIRNEMAALRRESAEARNSNAQFGENVEVRNNSTRFDDNAEVRNSNASSSSQARQSFDQPSQSQTSRGAGMSRRTELVTDCVHARCCAR